MNSLLLFAEVSAKQRNATKKRTQLAQKARRKKEEEEEYVTATAAAAAAAAADATTVPQNSELKVTDPDDRLAGILEAEVLPTDSSMSTPALQLMAFQRDAQGSHVLEVGETLVEVLQTVEEASEEERTKMAGGIDALPVLYQDGCYLDIAVQRKTIERAFGLQIRKQVQTVRPAWMTRKDSAAVVRHADNHRKGIVGFSNLQKPKEGYRALQLRILEIKNKEDLQEALRLRRQEIITCLSDGYMRVRVCALRSWVHFTIEGCGQNPWRLHWPDDRHDDEMMTEFLELLSMRYTDFSAIEASKTHVIEFHKGYLRVYPPEMPMAKWTLSKMKRLLATENPGGRKVRPGLDMAQVQLICADIMGQVMDPLTGGSDKRFLVNCGGGIAATHAPALRTGETCPGDHWNAVDYWSRTTIDPMMDKDYLAKPEVEAVILQAMKRKTVLMSPVAREKANLPILYDAKASHVAAFAVWGPLMKEIDPCERHEQPSSPAFRSGGKHSLPLSTEDLREVMKASAERVLGEDWRLMDYGMHSLRIGRENNLRKADVRPELLNDITSHTAMQGRAGYSRQETTELIEASRAADKAISTPLEKAVHFGNDRSSQRGPVGIGSDGTVVAGTSLQQGADRNMAGRGEGGSAAEAAAMSPKRTRAMGGMQAGAISQFTVKRRAPSPTEGELVSGSKE